jgi:uncharacterized protein (TIGR02147 family)
MLLQAELGRRCAKNSHYSLRAFAKFLGLDHATLSQLMRGKRRLTRKMITKLGTRLGLSEAQLSDNWTFEENALQFPSEPTKLQALGQITYDTAAIISDWYHFAILELTRLQDFRPDSRWIARVLGLNPDEVNIALARLMRLGLLEMVDQERWVDKSGDTVISLENLAQVSIERLARVMRDLMLDALGNGAEGDCIHHSTTLALKRSQLALVRHRIARFQKELTELLNQGQERDDVFHLEICLFPMTRSNQSKETSHGTTSDAVADRGSQPGPRGGILR